MAAKRILHIVGTMNRAGAETMVMNLYRHINKEKIQFDFIYFTDAACDYDEEITAMGGHIYRIGPKRNYLLAQYSRIVELYKILKRNNRYTTVHAHTLNNIGICLLIANLAGIKQRIAHAHSTKDGKGDSFYRKSYHYVSKWLIHWNATDLIACGKAAGLYLFGNKQREITILPNALDFNSIIKDKETNRKKLCNDLNLSLDTLLIGQIGRFQKVKNHTFTIKLIKEFQLQNINVHFIFAGTGPLLKYIQQTIHELNLVNFVTFIGNCQDIPQLLNSIDMIIMPSQYEGIPLTMIEAQAAGTPCIVSSNISDEADLKLDLVFPLDLNLPIMSWVDMMRSINKHSFPSIKTRLETFKRKGYDINSSMSILKNIYELNTLYIS